MDEKSCSTSKCQYKASYHNDLEESYYCERCAHVMFNPNECIKIGNISVITQMIRLSDNILESIRNYAIEEQLQLKWKSLLAKLNLFDTELREIKAELQDVLKDEKFKDLHKLEQRSVNLKFKITESEPYRKYLFHEDMRKHRLREEKTDYNLVVNNVPKIMTDIKVEEQKETIEEQLSELISINDSNSAINQDIEELKKKYSEEIEKIKQQQLEEKESYEIEKQKWLAQRVEIEQELNSFKSKANDKNDEPPCISYNAFNSLYKDFIGQVVQLNSSSGMTFFLNQDKWMNLIKELSKLRLPKINYYQLDYVPEDAEEVREFMRNCIQPMNQFWFNNNKQFQIEGSRYINELKEVAKISLTRLYIYNTNFTSKEFCELISAAKNVQFLYFFYNLISFDEECDFGTNMNKCKIGSINLSYSGNSNYSNWNQNPNRFENLIAAIAKCKPLTKSLNCLYINFCDFEKEKAQEILDKYKLKSLNVIS